MKRQTLEDLKKVMSTLRSPEGCPWDKKQTAKSLTPYAVEEALELEDAIHHKSKNDVIEELGDLLFQVVFQCQMAAEKGEFDLDDVIDNLSRKMIERHPHVFAKHKNDGKKITTDQDVSRMWELNKNRKMKSERIFDLPKNFPALLAAVKIGKKTRTIKFDWKKPEEVFTHFLSEVSELKQALKGRSKAHKEEEIGDSLFTLAQVARLLDIDPEKALRNANRKVVDRIQKSHKLSKLTWDEYCQLTLEEKEKLWSQVKRNAKKTKSSAKAPT